MDLQILKLKNRLREILDKIIQNSQRVYVHKGKKLTSSNVSSIWELRKKGEYTFSINQDHPYIKNYMDDLSKEKKINFLQIIKLIQENIPIHTIYSEMSHNPLKVNQNNDDPLKTAKITEIFYKEELNKGNNAKGVTLALIERSNPFLEHKDYILDYLKKRGINLNAKSS